jgi:hypothetical protein
LASTIVTDGGESAGSNFNEPKVLNSVELIGQGHCRALTNWHEGVGAQHGWQSARHIGAYEERVYAR